MLSADNMFPSVSSSHTVLMEKFNFVKHHQPLAISPWKGTWKVSMSRSILLNSNYWHCNRATNWPNWQELFNNEHQIPDGLFSARLAQTNRDGQAGTHTLSYKHTHTRGKQSMSQLENVLGSTIQEKSNQIKLAECRICEGCCCWQTAAGCLCVTIAVTRFSQKQRCLLEWSCGIHLWSYIGPTIMRAECCRSLSSGSGFLCCCSLSAFRIRVHGLHATEKLQFPISVNLPHAVQDSECVPLHQSVNHFNPPLVFW